MSDELPHSVAIVLESFDESDVECTRITATLYVNQSSQRYGYWCATNH
ncbi:MAG: hypothetical protein U0003_05960 [Vampirovibrionales bacterium]